VIKYISENESVLELCAGYGEFKNYLKSNDYAGIELNKNFVDYGKKKGYKLIQGNILDIEFPKSDVIVMFSSFYHFIDCSDSLIKKMKESSKKIIICEGYKCLTSSKSNILSKIGILLTKSTADTANKRWSEEELKNFFHKFDFKNIYSENNFVFGISTDN